MRQSFQTISFFEFQLSVFHLNCSTEEENVLAAFVERQVSVQGAVRVLQAGDDCHR